MRIGQSEPKRRKPILLIVLVVLSLVMLTMYFRESDTGLLHSARRVTLEITAPIARLGTIITSPVRAVGDYFEGIGASRERIQALEEQNQELRARLAELEEARQENERLRALVDFAEERKFAKLGAEVIRRPVSIWEGVIVIDRGSSDGVEAGMPVIAAQGLVGQVADVSSNSATVRLISDQQSGVSVIVQSTRTPGVVRGSLDGSLSLDFVDRAYLPVEGDRANYLALAAEDVLEHMRPHDHAVVGDAGVHECHLERRGEHVALSDRHVDGVAGQPHLVLGIVLVVPLLPRRIRHSSGDLAGEIDPRLLTQAEQPGRGLELLELPLVQLVADLVEDDVA